MELAFHIERKTQAHRQRPEPGAAKRKFVDERWRTVVAGRASSSFASWPCPPVLGDAAARSARILGAIDLCRLHALTFWDALVVRAASAAGCGRLLSEDMHDGQTIDGARIENPFG